MEDMGSLKKIVLVFLVLLLSTSGFIQAQETQNISDSRKEHIRKLLDYRFKGGYFSFERLFYSMVEYPVEAKESCMMGIVIISFEVNCKGEIDKMTMKNALYYGINKELEDFFSATMGQWNKCTDDRYTRFEIPIQFAIEGVKTNTTDAIFIIKDNHQGYPCYDDKDFYEKATKFLDKGNGKKALEYVKALMIRDPYNLEYSDMEKKAISLMK